MSGARAAPAVALVRASEVQLPGSPCARAHAHTGPHHEDDERASSSNNNNNSASTRINNKGNWPADQNDD